jgi:hypothetical protein
VINALGASPIATKCAEWTVLRGPILAWSSLSRTAASSASGVGGGAGSPFSFTGACVSLAGLCADRAVAVPPPELITPLSISHKQPRRSRNADLVSASPWWNCMINQPFRARPKCLRSPAVPAYPTEQTPETGTFPPRLARGIWSSWSVRPLAASPTPSSSCPNRSAGCHPVPKKLHEDARTARVSWASLIARASQSHSRPHKPRCARLRRAQGGVRMNADAADISI